MKWLSLPDKRTPHTTLSVHWVSRLEEISCSHIDCKVNSKLVVSVDVRKYRSGSASKWLESKAPLLSWHRNVLHTYICATFYNDAISFSVGYTCNSAAEETYLLCSRFLNWPAFACYGSERFSNESCNSSCFQSCQLWKGRLDGNQVFSNYKAKASSLVAQVLSATVGITLHTFLQHTQM